MNENERIVFRFALRMVIGGLLLWAIVLYVAVTRC